MSIFDQASQLALSLIKTSEGFRAEPYQDAGGVWTIGYGTTFIDGKPVTKQTTQITEERAISLASAHLSTVGESISTQFAAERVNKSQELTAHQLGALIDFAYNEGIHRLMGSTLWHMLTLGEPLDLVALQFGRWVYGSVGGKLQVEPGLVTRRKAESDMFLTADSTADV